MTTEHVSTETTKPTTSVVYVDPAMARRVLQANTRNRPISEHHVRKLMREMADGRWKFNGEAIKWSIDHILLDGQHRMTALSRMSDDFGPLPFLVVRGLPTDTQDTMDQGRVRAAGDQLVIDGVVGRDSKVVAGAIRVYGAWHSGALFRDKGAYSMSNPQVLEWAREHPVEMLIMDDLIDSHLRRVKMRPSVTLAIMLTLRQVDADAQREFAQMLYTGVGLEKGSPIIALRERLDRIRELKIRTPDRDLIALTIMAWNAWREGRSIARLQRPRNGVWTAETFPVPA